MIFATGSVRAMLRGARCPVKSGRDRHLVLSGYQRARFPTGEAPTRKLVAGSPRPASSLACSEQRTAPPNNGLKQTRISLRSTRAA